ncbi:MAG: hypothetical protein PWP04_262 [Candidatus Atribacteria bacterium]|nr:hypothetical protein [Candidatus Atribacteria bacterium]
MVTISVCVGSSCHLKGAYQIIEICEKFLEEKGLRERIELKGNFCLGRCTEEGVTVAIDGEILSGITPENWQQILREQIKEKLGEGKKD